MGAAQQLLAGLSSAPPALWTPDELGADLIGWWDFSDEPTVTHSGSTLTSIADKSGNGHTMTRTGSATWNATGGPGSEGVADIATGYLEASVAAGTFDSPDFLCFHSVWKKVGAATAFNAGPLQRSAGGVAAPFDAWGPNRYVGDGATFDDITTADDLENDALFTAWNILGQSVDFNVDLLFSEWINGVDVGYPDILTPYDDTATVLTMASRADHATSANMLIGESVATIALSNSNREKMEGYLAHKWNLESLLDAGHPYKSAAPTA